MEVVKPVNAQPTLFFSENTKGVVGSNEENKENKENGQTISLKESLKLYVSLAFFKFFLMFKIRLVRQESN